MRKADYAKLIASHAIVRIDWLDAGLYTEYSNQGLPLRYHMVDYGECVAQDKDYISVASCGIMTTNDDGNPVADVSPQTMERIRHTMSIPKGCIRKITMLKSNE